MCPRVHFRADPVQSRSRLLRDSELQLLRNFENHVHERPECREILGTPMLDHMCSYCRKSFSYITFSFSCHCGYYIEKSGDNDALTFVEIPSALTATRRILDLVENKCLRRPRRSSDLMWDRDKLHFYDRSKATAGSESLVTFSRTSTRTEHGQWSTCYTEIWRTCDHQRRILSRAVVILSNTRECSSYISRRLQD